MTLKRLIIFILIPVISLLLWPLSVHAEEFCGNGCELNDSYKRVLAQTAYTALYNAKEAFRKYVIILQKDYEADDGTCHDMYNAWKHRGFWGGTESAGELRWKPADWKGGSEVDSGKYKQKMKPTCKEMMYLISGEIEGRKTPTFKDYTDWHIGKMIDEAEKGNSSLNNVVSWFEKAKNGDYIDMSDEASDDICDAVGGCNRKITENDCDKIFKKGSSLVCVDKAGVYLEGTYNGKTMNCGSENSKRCNFEGNGMCNTFYPDGGKYKKIRFPCTYKYDDRYIGYTFPSITEFKKKMLQGDKGTTKCLEKLRTAYDLRENTFIPERAKASKALSVLGGAETQCCCEVNEEGKLTDKITRCIVNNAGFVEQNLDYGCLSAAQYQAKLANVCLTCGLKAKILAGVQKISANAFEVLNYDLVKLLAIAYLLYVAYLVLITVISPEAQKLSQFVGKLFIQGAKVAIAVLILTNPKALYSYVVNPILESGVDFGLAFSNIKSDQAETGSMDNTISQKIKEAGAEYTAKAGFDAHSNYLSFSTLEKLVGANANFSKEAAMIPALGQCLICNAMHNLCTWERLCVIPRINMLVTGLILLVFGVMIWLAIGFYILDCCLELGIVAAMMSFFVACWPFKLTSSYVRVGWNMLLNVFFNFVMMSVVIVTIVQLIVQALPTNVVGDINEDNVESINDQLEIIGLEIIVLVVCCLIGMKLTTESGNLANKFAGGAQIKMGGDLAGLAGDAVTKGAVGNMGQAGEDGKKQGMGGALGLAKNVVGGVAGSAAEASGLKGAAKAGKENVKNAFGGKPKSGSASFKK